MAPFLARSVGFLPVFFPPEGCLGHAPVHGQPLPVEALPVVIGHQAVLPQRLEDALRDPQLEAVMSRGSRAETGGVQRAPLAAGAEHIEDGLHTDAVGGGRLAAAERVGVHPLGDQGGDGLP